MQINKVKALVFDVFGTVTDYRGTIIKEGEIINKKKNLSVDWGKFALAWRKRYQPSMTPISDGKTPWVKLDILHRISLEEVLGEFNMKTLTEKEKVHLNLVWHRLRPWPDALEGLTMLKKNFIITTLSNGNMALLTDMAKYSNLPWDCILSAELVKVYKPDKRVYLMAAELLNLKPEEVMMVAAHKTDLHAAHELGLKTAFVRRSMEFGKDYEYDLTSDPVFDVVANDFIDLANQLL